MPMPTDDAEPAESGSAQKRRRQRRKTRVMPEIILIRCICRYASVADNCLVNVDLLFGGSHAILIPMGWAAMMMKHFVYKVSLEWLLPFDSDDEGDPDAPAATLVAVDSVLGSRQQFADLIRAAGDSADESEFGSSDKYDEDDDDDDDADDGPDDAATTLMLGGSQGQGGGQGDQDGIQTDAPDTNYVFTEAPDSDDAALSETESVPLQFVSLLLLGYPCKSQQLV